MHRPSATRGSKHKPSKGQNMFRAQARKAQARKKAFRQIDEQRKVRQSIPAQLKKKWAELSRWFWKTKHLKGKYTPHQGPQEMARRRRQMREHKCINPEVWNNGQA